MAAGPEICCPTAIIVVPGTTTLINRDQEYPDRGDCLRFGAVLQALGAGPASQILRKKAFNSRPCLVDLAEVVHGQVWMFCPDAFATLLDVFGQARATVVMVAEHLDHQVECNAEQIIMLDLKKNIVFFLSGHAWPGADNSYFLGFHIVEEGAFGDARSSTDVLDRDIVKTTLEHEPGGVIFDRLQGLLAFEFTERGLFWNGHFSKPSASLHSVQYCTQ